jgi:hypothetical protein
MESSTENYAVIYRGLYSRQQYAYGFARRRELAARREGT